MGLLATWMALMGLLILFWPPEHMGWQLAWLELEVVRMQVEGSRALYLVL